MDIKAYIESGTLEAYILGALSETERQQVEADVARYPELRAELRTIEETMLQYAQQQAVEPAPAMQDKIWSAINAESAGMDAGAQQTSSQPHPKVIPLQPGYAKPLQWKYAAIIVLLIGSVVLNFVLWNLRNNNDQAFAALNKQLDSLKTTQNQLAQQLSNYRQSTAMMADTGMQTIVMHTVVPGHPMAATIYWSKSKGDTYVAMNALPAPPAGMQYQLWVIQGGKPVSMGTLPGNMANTPGMKKVPMRVTTGEAFAISLEKEGGNPTPTTVYVLGKA